MSVLFSFSEAVKAAEGEWVGAAAEGVVESVFTDTRETVSCALFIALTGEKFDAHDYLKEAVQQGAVLLCVERSKKDKVPPGIPAFAVESTVTAYQALANFHRKRFPDLKVLALTGSCGKTGTKETLRAIFNHVYGAEHVLATEGNTNNQIGVPRNLLRLTPAHKIAIIEMGTNHHGEIEPLSATAEPDGALIVSIGNCHLEFLGSLEGVAQEKSQIFSHLAKDGFAVIPAQCAGHDILEKATEKFHRITFGFEDSADVRVVYLGGNIAGSSFELIYRNERALVQWSLSGKHHACNAAGAAALALSFGIPLNQIAQGISRTELPGMRLRRTEHHGAVWINDAYNANPDSMRASLEWLSEFAVPEQLVLVLGDMGELGDNAQEEHAKLLRLAREKFPTSRLIAVGKRMSEAALFDKNIISFVSSASAAEKILDYVKPGDTIFLKASRSTRLELVEPGL